MTVASTHFAPAQNEQSGDPMLPHLIIFEDDHFRGNQLNCWGSCPYVGELNDKMSSFIIQSGNWQFYIDATYQTPCGGIFGPGAYPTLTGTNIPNDQVSSVKYVSPSW